MWDFFPKKKDIKMLKWAIKIIKFSHRVQPRGEEVGQKLERPREKVLVVILLLLTFAFEWRYPGRGQTPGTLAVEGCFAT